MRLAPGARHRLRGRIVNREEIDAVHSGEGHAQRFGTLHDLAGDDEGACRRFPESVVLNGEDHRQLPYLGEVHAFGGGALIDRPVAREDHGDIVATENLRRQCRAAGQRRAAADDAIGAEHSFRKVGDVHRTALAAADARVLAENFRHHPMHVASLGDAVPVAAMRRGDMVGLGEMHAHAHRRRLLPGIEMGVARNVAARHLGADAILEDANGPHCAVRLQQFFSR